MLTITSKKRSWADSNESTLAAEAKSRKLQCLRQAVVEEAERLKAAHGRQEAPGAPKGSFSKPWRTTEREHSWGPDIDPESAELSELEVLYQASMLLRAKGQRFALVGDDPTATASALHSIADCPTDVYDFMLVDKAEEGSNLSALEVMLGDDPGTSAEPQHASRILHGLGFTDAMEQQPTETLSYEWRKRARLAYALFLQPDVLLLQEPTQYLTLEGVLWLTRHLQHCEHTVMLVSNDPSFLSAVATHTILVDDDELRALSPGFKIPWAMDWYKSQWRWRPFTTWMPHDNKPIVELRDVGFDFWDGGDFSLQELNMRICKKLHVGLFGAKGGGKSILMDLLAGALEPLRGEVRQLGGLRIGHYAQHTLDALVTTSTAIDHLMQMKPRPGHPWLRVAEQLYRFGLSARHHERPICRLSSSQKAAVMFAAFALEEYDLLLLDEPTQHLDMHIIEVLANFLREKESAFVISSNNAELLMRVLDETSYTQIWTLDDGRLEHFKGYFNELKHGLVKRTVVKDRLLDPSAAWGV